MSSISRVAAVGLGTAVVYAAGAAPAPVVLADGWEPYYRLAELRSRFGFRLEPCGPGWRVLPPGGAAVTGR